MDGDAATALNLARELRADGMHPLSVKVGNIELELAAVVGPQAATALGGRTAIEERKGVLDEWGGESFKRQLNEPDLVDDEEQPAVRS